MVEPVALFNLLIKGFITGVIVSAPLGPVGILCIQRTLNKGRWYGFVTGLGAMLSDLIYALLTGYCMSFISGFITRYMHLFQWSGSLLLFLFGLYTFRSHPSYSIQQQPTSKGTYMHNFVTAFLVTLSNPLIIFLFIGLFARFAPAGPTDLFFKQFSSYFAIAAGAVAWWFAITYGVNKVRERFDIRKLRLINRIVGGCVMIASLLSAIFTWSGKTLY
ncbi:MAG: LysE family translocator [Bacteroidaceae bacterium]|jgi:threonine/homoserine/homoserine lactone efflux protein